MKYRQKNISFCFVFLSIVFISQIGASQVQPKFIFQHVDVDGFVKGLSFSHDNTKLLTTGGQVAMMWDLKTGEKIMTFPPYSGFSFIDFSPDDKRIVTSHVLHAKVALWDVQTGKEIKTIQGEIDLLSPTSYTAVTFTNDGQKILAGDNNNSLYVIDIEQEKVIQKFKGLGGYVDNIQVYPDGDRVLASLSVLSLGMNKVLRKIDKSWPILSYSGDEIYSCEYNQVGTVEQYSFIVMNSDTFETQKQYSTFPYTKMLALSPTGNVIAVTGKQSKNGDIEELPSIINVENGKSVRAFSLSGKLEIVFDQVKFSRDGKLLAFTKGDTVYIYDISDLTSSVKNAEQLGQQ